jgi:MFS family permease
MSTMGRVTQGRQIGVVAAAAAALSAFVAAMTFGELLHNFHNGDVGERLFTRMFVFALVAALAVLIALAAVRSRRVRPSLFAIGAAGVMLIGLGVWLGVRPADMGSYEPNCLPPVVEGVGDGRCSAAPQVGFGLSMFSVGVFLCGTFLRKSSLPTHSN